MSVPGLRREDLPVLDRLLCMAWEWVAPVVTGTAGVVGVVFTWFAGAQGRKHTERMIEQTRLADDRTRLLNERKDAYLTALRTIELRKRRERYRERGKLERIQQLDERWPKAERVHMEMEALIGIRAFGSKRVLDLADRWYDADEAGDAKASTELVEQLQQAIRAELHGGAQADR
ncbi:hypothetical protein GCM10022251_71710 [Phytohabitans flavus]|uniref:Uncharacterized protein n=1 Tax=Phytohabitans flavus TaxID=1076124 RepID=A0A6F8Y040_9ACTN|nr:hypothetical protein [Phytohabitans flavus]BCB79430.1 hypothetical protein Pflav_058400 [Phytohabitans flavus]